MLKHFVGWILFLAICFAIPGRAQEPRATPPPSIEFNNLFSETHEPEAIKLYWSCVNGSDNVVIRYRRAIKGDAPWVYTAPIPGDNLHYELTELLGNESYIWQVGGSPSGDFSDPDKVVWSGEEKFKTLRGFGFLGFMIILGALGFFIYGMKVMSEGIQKVAGQKMRNILGAMTSNRFMGLLTGIFITGLIQSSSATTVMTVSFVNAGLLSLAESIGIIMGANIGTTVTGFLISIFGFKVNIASITLPIIAIGLPLMFSSRSSLKSWAEVLIGFALLFMGLQALKDSIPDLDWSFVSSIPMDAWWALPLFVGIGTLLTILVQSSSAAMALTIVLCNQGLIPFEMAAGIIMGENIGTTVTANLAALIANVHAKRAARAHFIFNVFGVIWMMFAYNLFLNTIDYYITSAGDASPFTEPTSVPIALSIFHATFNLTNSLLLIWFVRPIEKLVIRMVPSKGEDDEKYHLEYIGSMTATSELALMEASKELAKLGHLTRRMLEFTNELLVSKPGKKTNLTFERIEKYEEITDRMEVEVADYLMKLSEGEISNRSSLRVRSMLSIVGDLERIGDIFYQMSKTLQRKMKEKIWFTPEQRNSLRDMLAVLDRAFEVMLNNLDQNYEKANMEAALALEKEINELRDRMRHEQLKSIENKNYNIHSGIIYTDLYSSCEKIGDHLIAVTQAVTGEV